nr:reverse transcriptase domain-containing protein [Tanacetum cinerariifolium]
MWYSALGYHVRGGTGGRAGRGGGRTRGRSGGQGDGRNDGPGGQVGGQGSEVTKVEVKELVGIKMAMPLINTSKMMLGMPLKMESVHDTSGCRDSQRVKASHAAYIDRFHELARLVPHLVTPKGDVTWVRHPSVPPVAIIIRLKHLIVVVSTITALDIFAKECRVVPRNVNPTNARNPVARTCYECDSTNHIRSACPRLNQAQRPGRKQQNKVVAVNKGQGHGNQGNQARCRAFMLGAEEARQDSNIMTGMFTLKDYYATTLFDSGAEYIFVSTTFLPLLDIEPSDLGFRYEIEIASGLLVEINKVIRGCKLEIKGHMFNINLIPFRSRSFDVIIGMDGFSDHRAEIICHEKIVMLEIQKVLIIYEITTVGNYRFDETKE